MGIGAYTQTALVDEPACCSRVTNIVRRGPIPSV